MNRAAVDRGLHAQQLRQPRHLGEAAGVVRAGDSTRAGPAGRTGFDAASGALVALDFVGVTAGVGVWPAIRGRFGGCGEVCHGPEWCHKPFSEGLFRRMRENEF
jgi:hypothetical protein